MKVGVKSRTKREQKKGICVFCGGTPLSKEDVWPTWIGVDLGKAPVLLEATSRNAADEPHTVIRIRPGMSYTARRRRVCEDCNNGWMSRLEDQAAPLLKRMFAESIVLQLTVAQQTLLANWVFKTALMLQFVNVGRVIPLGVYREFYRLRRPVKSIVFIARRSRQQQLFDTIVHGVGWTIGEQPRTSEPASVDAGWRAYGFTFAIYNLVFQMVGVWMHGPQHWIRPPFPPPAAAPYIQALWPIAAEIPCVTWPPSSLSLDAAGFEQFCFSIRDAVRPRQSPLFWVPGM
jgi:hypothetical protein